MGRLIRSMRSFRRSFSARDKRGWQPSRSRVLAARATRAMMVGKARGIKVSTGVGRNGFSKTVGSGYRPRSRFQRRVQKVIFATTEKKYRSASINYAAGTDLQINAPPWKHNMLYYINLWNCVQGTGTAGTRLFPTQGMTDGNRIGDEIYATGISVKLMINIPSDRRTMNLKCWFVPWNTVQGDPANKSHFFHQIVNNVMVDKLQTDRWPGAKYLGLFRNNDPDNTTTTAHGQIYIKLWIPLKRKITFITDGDTITARGLREVGSLIFAPYDKIGSIEDGDNLINNFQGEATLHYKDP